MEPTWSSPIPKETNAALANSDEFLGELLRRLETDEPEESSALAPLEVRRWQVAGTDPPWLHVEGKNQFNQFNSFADFSPDLARAAGQLLVLPTLFIAPGGVLSPPA